MTVAELIKLLEQQNQAALVFVPDTQTGDHTPVAELEALRAHVNAQGYVTSFFTDNGDPERACVFIS